MQASAACELVTLALALTDEPSIDYASTLNRIKQLVEVLEISATALLVQRGDISWEKLADGLDGVTRQSFHRRLSPKVNDLMDLPPREVRYHETRDTAVVKPLPVQSWVSHLKSIEPLIRNAAEREYHPAIVKHQRRSAKHAESSSGVSRI